jgi:hypothetical protein
MCTRPAGPETRKFPMQVSARDMSFPATTIRASSPERAHTSCDPRCRMTSHPASFNAVRTSRYFLATVRG